MKISLEEAQNNLGSLIGSLSKEDEIILLDHDKEIARIVRPRNANKRLQSLKKFRASIHISGESLSNTILSERKQSRY